MVILVVKKDGTAGILKGGKSSVEKETLNNT